MSEKLKLQYTMYEGRTERRIVTDHGTFYTAKSARIRAKVIRATKNNAHDFQIVDEAGNVTELEFSDPVA